MLKVLPDGKTVDVDTITYSAYQQKKYPITRVSYKSRERIRSLKKALKLQREADVIDLLFLAVDKATQKPVEHLLIEAGQD